MTDQLWTIKRMLEWATEYFSTKHIESPRLLVEYAIAEVLGLKRLDLYLKFDRPLSQQELEKMRPLVKRLGNGEPLQYVLGHQDFYNLRLKIDPRALIPRPETEELVEWICTELGSESFDSSVAKLWDIGTGSGCIALAIKNAYPALEVLSSDNSTDALALAKENAELIALDVNFFEHDFTKLLKATAPQQLDIIVSNPPYIHPNELNTVDKHVHNWEPHSALYTDNILSVYQCIANQAKEHLKVYGHIYLELNPLIASDIAQLFNEQIGHAEIKKDIADKERFLKVTRHF